LISVVEVTPREIKAYTTKDGKVPFDEWLYSLKSSQTIARILLRFDRVQQGNLGDYKVIDAEVCELRLDFGAGYRVYFGQEDNVMIILLCGGDKSSQKQDIKTAKKYWSDYRSRKDD
jgi:putative addiction module killer protein